eukprot:589379-Rhodomonas_salina.7
MTEWSERGGQIEELTHRTEESMATSRSVFDSLFAEELSYPASAKCQHTLSGLSFTKQHSATHKPKLELEHTSDNSRSNG